MTIDEAIRELGSLFSLNAAVIARAAALLTHLKAHGVTITMRSTVLKRFVPQVADGKLSAEAVAAFADEPRVLNAISRLPVAEQTRLATGGTLEVLTEAGGPTVSMGVREVVRHGLPALVGGRILSPEQQRLQLIARDRAAKAAPPPKPPTATEAQAAALARLLAAEVAKRGGALTPNVAAEIVAAAGWTPPRPRP